MPKVEVLPHHDGLCVEEVNQNRLNKVLSGFERTLFIEWNNNGLVDSRTSQKFEFLVQVSEEPRSRLGTNHLGGMPVEGNDSRAMPTLSGLSNDTGNHSPVTEMHTVIGTNGDNGALCRVVRGKGVTDDQHVAEATDMLASATQSASNCGKYERRFCRRTLVVAIDGE
jgi:hypothetical protein